MRRIAVRIAGFVVLTMAASPGAASAGQFTGKFWIVPQSAAGNASAPPTTTPDATFTATHLSFWLDAPLPANGAIPALNNTVGTFLNSADRVKKLAFSGLVNGTIKAVVGPNTPLTDSTGSMNGTFGACLEFTGRAMLAAGELITVTHDDGVGLKVDGAAVSGLTSGAGGAVVESPLFSGITGVHTIDLTYCNVHGPGILSFSPAM